MNNGQNWANLQSHTGLSPKLDAGRFHTEIMSLVNFWAYSVTFICVRLAFWRYLVLRLNIITEVVFFSRTRNLYESLQSLQKSHT